MSKFLYRVCQLLIILKREKGKELTDLGQGQKLKLAKGFWLEEKEKVVGNSRFKRCFLKIIG